MIYYLQYGLKVEVRSNFHTFIAEHSRNPEFAELLRTMGVAESEPLNAFSTVLRTLTAGLNRELCKMDIWIHVQPSTVSADL